MAKKKSGKVANLTHFLARNEAPLRSAMRTQPRLSLPPLVSPAVLISTGSNVSMGQLGNLSGTGVMLTPRNGIHLVNGECVDVVLL